jgi:preprotein translocase subunit SecA
VKGAAYACDVAYATNNEPGFDYLRDNMAFTVDQKVSVTVISPSSTRWIPSSSTRRTPLIISGPPTNRRNFTFASTS